ncbi:hypothetical protein M011DRAFT_476086 [Sporormia fimetaria CBS 119925]|uniref:Uncharacterized protein n=1 Tax=Sporormia fimetaria CBS 119925 TaxID=1340428 RepID=A0A6A6VDL2_9PLEO|nr:hypothetical protein M011DRAFT_476086 [Sporormia fimetaria CBS 119925]
MRRHLLYLVSLGAALRGALGAPVVDSEEDAISFHTAVDGYHATHEDIGTRSEDAPTDLHGTEVSFEAAPADLLGANQASSEAVAIAQFDTAVQDLLQIAGTRDGWCSYTALIQQVCPKQTWWAINTAFGFTSMLLADKTFLIKPSEFAHFIHLEPDRPYNWKDGLYGYPFRIAWNRAADRMEFKYRECLWDSKKISSCASCVSKPWTRNALQCHWENPLVQRYREMFCIFKCKY